ncbi:WD40 repeat-like protein [Atractiella rhizophila]|nr:WD40 repeat-like protein [Atractiella rhizophila]
MTSQYLAEFASTSSGPIWCCKWIDSSFTPSGSLVITSGVDRKVSIWDPQKPDQPQATFENPSSLGVNALDSREDYVLTCSLDSTVCRWDLGDGGAKLVGKKAANAADIFTIALSPKSSVFATTGRQGNVKLLNATGGAFAEELGSSKGRGDFGMSLSWNRDGSMFSMGSEAGQISILNAETCAVIDTFPAHTNAIRSLAFSPATVSNFLISGGDDGKINVFDIRTSHSQSRKGGGGHIAQFGFGPAAAKVSLWVTSMAIKSDGKLLCAGGSDGSLALFDLSNLNPSPLAVYPRQHSGDVWSMSWKPEEASGMLDGMAPGGGGKWVSCGEDGVIKWFRASGR